MENDKTLANAEEKWKKRRRLYFSLFLSLSLFRFPIWMHHVDKKNDKTLAEEKWKKGKRKENNLFLSLSLSLLSPDLDMDGK